MKSQWFILVAIGLVLCGCAGTPPPKEEFEKQRLLMGTFDKAWSAAVQVLAENEWPIEAMEKESGLITTSFLDFGANDSYHACASGMAYMFTKFRGKLSIFIKSIAIEESEIRINTHLEAWNTSSWGNEGWANCNSNGKLERDLFDQIISLLQ